MLQTGWNTLVLLCFNNKRRRRRSCRRTVADFFFRCDGVGEIPSVLVLFPDVHRLAVPRACSLNESHRVARCLINLRRWTPVSVLRWICGPHDGESCCNMKPGSRRSHISLLQRRLRRPQPVVIWVYSALCAQSSCSPRQFLAALERHRVCRAAITLRRCPAVCVCVCVNYCYHPGDSGGRQVRHLEEDTHGGYLDEPPWSSVNMKFCSLLLWQQEVWMIVACGAISLSLSLSLSLHSLLMMFHRLAHSSPVTQWASLMGGTEREMLPLLHHCCNVINLKSDW